MKGKKEQKVDVFSNKLRYLFCNENSKDFLFKEGQDFGHFAFFTGQPYIYKAQSKEFVSLFYIKRSDFLRVVRKNQKDYEQFCMLKDSLLYNAQSNSPILPKCVSCGLNTHETIFCNFFHFIPDREKIIKKYEFSVFQERNPDFNRKSHMKKMSKSQTNDKKLKAAFQLQKQLKREIKSHNFFNMNRVIDFDNVESDLFDSKNSIQFPENSQTYISEQEQSIIEEDLPDEDNSKYKKNEKLVRDSALKKETNVKQEGNPLFSLENLEQIAENSKESSENINVNKMESLIIENKDNPPNETSKKFESSNSFKTKSNNQRNIDSKISSEPTKFPLNSQKKPINNNNSQFKNYLDMDLGFEKYEIFENYFPTANINQIIRIYHQKEKKNAFFKKIFPKNQESFKRKKNSNLKDYNKYSFFAEPVIKKTQSGKKNLKEIIQNANRSENCDSPFFRKKEFKKNDLSFFQLVENLSKNKKK